MWKFVTFFISSRSFIPYTKLRFEQGKHSKLQLECGKMALLAVLFSKTFRGACPRTHLEKQIFQRSLCPLGRKESYIFRKNPLETLIYVLNYSCYQFEMIDTLKWYVYG